MELIEVEVEKLEEGDVFLVKEKMNVMGGECIGSDDSLWEVTKKKQNWALVYCYFGKSWGREIILRCEVKIWKVAHVDKTHGG